jgi:UDP-N-acetylglucosamine 1-carboxyvinyltransferase
MRSKNATLPILAAALLADSGVTTLRDVPDLRDIDIMLQVLRELGAKVEWDRQTRTVKIEAEALDKDEAPYDLVRKMRASFLVLGALIGRLHRARVSLPGGCSLGQRPVNLHLQRLRNSGSRNGRKRQGMLLLMVRSRGTIYFDRRRHRYREHHDRRGPSSGVTRIVNAACDPEVVSGEFLNQMGADIAGAGIDLI